MTKVKGYLKEETLKELVTKLTGCWFVEGVHHHIVSVPGVIQV